MAKGVIDPVGAARRIRMNVYPPSLPLQSFVEYYWVVEWDLRGGSPEMQRVLPYPNAHLVFDAGRTALHGVMHGVFERELVDTGRVFGVRFMAGGLRPFISQPLESFTDATLAPDAMLHMSAAMAEQRVLRWDNDQDMVAATEAMLLPLLPEPDERALLAARAVGAAAAIHGPVCVADLCRRIDLTERALQRLFSEYVGVSPKWVIQRFRLQQAAWELAKPGSVDLSELAVRLGFYDQAHLSRHFKLLLGTSPLAYWKSQRPSAAGIPMAHG